MEKAFEELQIKDDFMFSVIMRLRNYLTGFVKEGAGAGGMMFTALVLGSSVEELREKIEKVCE